MKTRLMIVFLLTLSMSNLSIAQRECATNLAWARYWGPQIIFKDLFKQSAPWLTRNATSTTPWNTNVSIPVDANCYPLSVPFGTPAQYVHTLLFNGAGGTYPAGVYTILSEGTGTIQLEWDGGTHTFTSPCNNTFNVIPTNQGIHLTITASSAGDPVRNIRVIMPGFISDYETEPFYPPFLNYVDSANVFKAIRFMDLINTNNSPVAMWSQRTLKTTNTQAGINGMSYEYMVDICNETNRDMWISIPHLADDTFIQNFAQLIKDSLNPNLKVYVEYTNEAWNNIFQQNAYCNAQGAALGYTGTAWEQGWKFYAKRSADVHRIFEQTFGVGSGRLVKVVSSQAGNSYVGNYVLSRYNEATYNPTGVTADAFAIAPYFGNGLADSIGVAGGIITTSVPQLLNLLHAKITTQVLPQVTSNKTVANTFGLDLLAYEGGSHFVATNATYFNDTTLTQKILEVNHDPFMETIYCDYFDTWYNNGGGLFFNFTSPAFSTGQWASLSIIDNMEQPLYSSYKWRAMRACASDTTAITTGIENDLEENKLLVYPNPNNGNFTINSPFDLGTGFTIELWNNLGQLIHQEEVASSNETITVNDNKVVAGIYYLKIYNAKQVFNSKITINN
ncbi:MAG: T9SS type A sorting domain-containing protein [Bacteroidetes bacterium]|nr:T9SS type A sorting domain-containing protein [Bacteroidota bacterium]